MLKSRLFTTDHRPRNEHVMPPKTCKSKPEREAAMIRKLLIGVSVLVLFSGCATLTQQEPKEGQAPLQTDEGLSRQDSAQMSNYFDFEDILIPQEMELDAERSIIFETPSLKAGALVFTGRVDPVSLFNFLMNSMPQDNWKPRSYFKYGRYLMVFEKENRVCVIRIQEERFKTLLHVWVTPRITSQESGMMQEKILSQ